MSRTIINRCALALSLLAGCDKDPESPPPGKPLGSVVVLNGQDPTGITVVPDTDERGDTLGFDPFDGVSFVMRNDTVLSTSSKGAGDLLYIGSIAGGTVEKIQMPGASNPGGAQFGLGAQARIFVALRDDGQVAEVPLPKGSGPTVLHNAAGVCPVDVIVATNAIWALDSNQRCTSDYAILGASQMLPLPGKGSSDTIQFVNSVVGAQRAIVVGNFAYVMSAGDYFSIPGAFVRVDLTTRNHVFTPLPPDRYGVSLRIGKNGVAYVTGTPPYPDVGFRTYAINPQTMGFVGTRMPMEFHLRLIKTGGAEASCFAATADADGNVYCLENGNTTSTLLVFNPAGNQIRSASAGSLAYDIDLR